MPDALIVSEKECTSRKNGTLNAARLIRLLVKRRIISSVRVKGKLVYGRAYMNRAAVRAAFYKNNHKHRSYTHERC